MTKTEYGQYLCSPEWKAKRQEAFEHFGATCNRCSMPRWLAEIAYDQDLHVHHKTYVRRGDEEMDDLEVICRRCHEVETYGRSELRAPKRATCEACKATHWNYREGLCEVCFSICIDGSFGARLRCRDLSDADPMRLIWHSVARSLASCVSATRDPKIQDLLCQIANVYAGRTVRGPYQIMPDFDAALSLVDFGNEWYSDEETLDGSD